MKRLAVAALAVALCAPAAFAHGDGDHGRAEKPHGHGEKAHAAALGVPGDPAKATRTIAIGMSDAMRFAPPLVEVKTGETVRFLVTNRGRLRHEMVLGAMKELREHAAQMRRSPGMEHHDPNAVSLGPGETGTLVWKLTKAGRLSFACLLPGHLEAGMSGRIVVR